MRRVLIILVFIFLLGPSFLIAQTDEAPGIPVGAFFRLGVMQGAADRTQTAFDFGGGFKYAVTPSTITMVAVFAYQAEYTKEDGLNIDLEQNLSLKTVIRQYIWKDWGVEGGPGFDRLDYIGDAQTAVTYVTGYIALAKTWSIQNFCLGFAVGTDYNFGLQQTTPKLSLLIEFGE